MGRAKHAVLLFGSDHSSQVLPYLVDMGYEVVARSTTAQLVEDLRHGSYRAVVLDHDGLDCDVLEVILNIQDFNKDMPVIVVSKAQEMEYKELLVSLGRIYLINGNGREEQLRQGLRAALEPVLGTGSDCRLQE